MHGNTGDRKKTTMSIDHVKKLQEHVQLSPYAGTMKNPDMHWEGENPSCGDALLVGLRIKNGKVVDARFTHRGCALSGASASIFLDSIMGKSISSIAKITPEKHLASIGIPISSGRLNCALLPLRGITSGHKK